MVTGNLPYNNIYVKLVEIRYQIQLFLESEFNVAKNEEKVECF